MDARRNPVDTIDKAKLTARLRAPKSSIGILAGTACFILLVSIAALFEDLFSLLKSTPLGLLGFLAVSVCTGILIQHRFTRKIDQTIVSPTSRKWLHTVRRLFLFARESNILLAIMIVIGVAYPITMFSAARSIQTIVGDCKQDLDSQIQLYDDQRPPLSFSGPLCKCLSGVFLNKNGIVRLALFRTELLDTTAYQGVTEADERACLNLVLGGREQFLSTTQGINIPRPGSP
ncbi:hypothetical protein IV01_23860 [Pseudomonas syringae]|uniref:Uncharacterized protein n=1 Tax=Pseudomonas syringae TaxID=317 RepID=A0A085V782_PSESX|nr:hypothetical protein IV01_23860 [Pseudomonas syringae]